MNRRSVLKTFLFVSAGAALIPACMHDKGKASFLLKNVDINGDQEKMLASLSDAILPTTPGVPGAKELSSHLFVMMMVDDCLRKDDANQRTDQKRFMAGMAAFEKLVQDKYNTDFTKLSPEQKTELLTGLEKDSKPAPGAKDKKEGPADITVFYNTIKNLTIQSFTSSQYFLTKVQVYELVPGRYHGCVPLKTA